MCIAAFLWKAHPIYPFLLFLNRDEYYDRYLGINLTISISYVLAGLLLCFFLINGLFEIERPTKALAWWDDGVILGGRDVLAGGTWLGCNLNGKIAFLTNVREVVDLPSSHTKSRGDLPVRFLRVPITLIVIYASSWLQSNKSPRDFAEELMGEADHFGGFNLIVVDICSMTMFYITNRPKDRGVSATEVLPGIHVLTNASLDSPWPKAQRLQKGFKLVLEEYGESEIPLESAGKQLMKDTTKDEERNLLPGIYAPEREYRLSSIFVEADEDSEGRYGTRSTSALAIKNSLEVNFYEMRLENDLWKEQTISFKIEKSPTPAHN
nr:uncharacterized protein LOC109162132 isoform X1 [Ipomoea trifida]